jgi:hypothetical protein
MQIVGLFLICSTAEKMPRKIPAMKLIRRESNPDHSTIADGVLYGLFYDPDTCTLQLDGQNDW